MPNRSQYTFMLLGNGPYTNRGCEAIVRGTVSMLRREFGECRFISCYTPDYGGMTDASEEIDSAIEHHPLHRVERYNLFWLRRQILRLISSQLADESLFFPLKGLVAQADAVLMVGGDNYTSDYSGPHSYLTLNRMVRLWNKPVVMWGASIGPFSHDSALEQMAAQELDAAALICVRESLSQHYLESIGVCKNVVLTADPAFWLEPSAVQLDAAVEDALERGCVGLNLSPLIGRYAGYPDVSDWIEAAAQMIKSLERTCRFPLLLVPHVTTRREQMVSRDDHLFMREAMTRANVAPDRVLLLDRGYNAAETKWVISRLRAFVGARTHSTIAALSSCVPTVLLAYSAKAQGIGNDVYGHDNWTIPVSALDSRVMTQVLQDILDSEKQIRSFLMSRIPGFRDRAYQSAVELHSLLRRD